MLPFRDLYPDEGWIQKLDLDMKFTSEFWVYGGGGGGGGGTGGLLGMVLYFKLYTYY